MRLARLLGKGQNAAYLKAMGQWISRQGPLVIVAAVMAVSVAVLLAMDRPPICMCGTVELWGELGPKQSQMLADWYSPSHIIHGFLLYGAFRWLLKNWSSNARLTLAMVVEACWEILENTPIIIDRYREATVALGYVGDSVLNSASDILMMAIGYFAARNLPIWASILLVLLLELIPLVVIRDNLTLNVWMLLAPSDAIVAWQSAAGTVK